MRAGGLSGLGVAGATVLAVGGLTAMDTPSDTDEDVDTGTETAAEDGDHGSDDMEPGSGDLILVGNEESSDEGSGSSTCTNTDTSSLREAAKNAEDEDRILLCEGTYTIDSKPVTLDADGVTLEGRNDLDPSAVTIDADGYEKDDAPLRVTGDDVDIKNMEFSGSPDYQVHASDADGLDIDNNVFTDAGDAAIAVGGSAGSEKPVIENNTFDVADADSAMLLRNTENTTVASNKITGDGDSVGIAAESGNEATTIQGNRIRGNKSAVKLGKHGDDGDRNADVEAHMNSFEKDVTNGVDVDSGAVTSDAAVDADDNYWGCAAGADESGCAGTDVSDSDDVNVSTDDALRAPIKQSRTSSNVRDEHSLTSGETDGHDLTDMDAYAQGWEGHGTVTATTFEDNPRATDIADTSPAKDDLRNAIFVAQDK